MRKGCGTVSPVGRSWPITGQILSLIHSMVAACGAAGQPVRGGGLAKGWQELRQEHMAAAGHGGVVWSGAERTGEQAERQGEKGSWQL